MSDKNEWTIGCPIEIEEAAKTYCRERNIPFKEYGKMMLDPSRIIGNLGEKIHPDKVDDLDGKSIDELVEIIVDKKIKALLKKKISNIV